jgi:hypothetical protein
MLNMCVTSGVLSAAGCIPCSVDSAPCAWLHSGVVASGALALSSMNLSSICITCMTVEMTNENGDTNKYDYYLCASSICCANKIVDQ